MCTVLVVDDEDSIRKTTRRVLARRGHEVLDAADGAAALKVLELRRLERRRVDIVLTDVRMPNVDGVALTRELRKATANPPVIVAMSGDPDLAGMAEKLGADLSLAKPFTLKELEAAITAAEELRRRHQTDG